MQPVRDCGAFCGVGCHGRVGSEEATLDSAREWCGVSEEADRCIHVAYMLLC